MRFRDLIRLDEMILRYGNPRGNGLLIAFRESIWILPYGDEQKNRQAIQDIKAKTGLDVENTDSIQDYIDVRPDILIGNINDGELYVDGNRGGSHHPFTSKLIQKVVKQLGLTVSTSHMDAHGDEYNNELQQNQIRGNLPEIGYHGTGSQHIHDILRLGLRPDQGSNWISSGIQAHDGLIFLAVEKETAIFHANKTALAANGAFPVVLEMKIPDKRLLGADYDVAMNLYGPDHEISQERGFSNNSGAYDHSGTKFSKHAEIAAANKRSQNLWKSGGVFSYKGRIPAAFITRTWSNFEPGEPINQDNIQEAQPSELPKAIEMVDNLGFYDPNYDPEQQDDNWNDDPQDDEYR